MKHLAIVLAALTVAACAAVSGLGDYHLCSGETCGADSGAMSGAEATAPSSSGGMTSSSASSASSSGSGGEGTPEVDSPMDASDDAVHNDVDSSIGDAADAHGGSGSGSGGNGASSSSGSGASSSSSGSASSSGSSSGGPHCGGSACPTSTCCGASCQTAHSNAVGQTFYDCTATGTYNETQATEACAAFAGSASACSMQTTALNPVCPGANAVCATSGSSCHCWIYSAGGLYAGLLKVGTVQAPAASSCVPICSGPSDPSWN